MSGFLQNIAGTRSSYWHQQSKCLVCSFALESGKAIICRKLDIQGFGRVPKYCRRWWELNVVSACFELTSDLEMMKNSILGKNPLSKVDSTIVETLIHHYFPDNYSCIRHLFIRHQQGPYDHSGDAAIVRIFCRHGPFIPTITMCAQSPYLLVFCAGQR